jgi:hypothetical protein
MSDNVSTKNTKGKSLFTAVTTAVKDSVPKTTGGKVVAGIGSAIVAVGSFFLGRLSNGKKSK